MLPKKQSTKIVKGKAMTCDRKELVEGIFSGVRTPILAISLSGDGPPTILDCNRAALDLIGYERSEVVDRSMGFLYSEERSKIDLWKPLRVAGKRNIDVVGYELKRKDGTLFMASLKVSPLLNGAGRQVGAITVMGDLTQTKRKEEHRMKYEDRLLALHNHSVQLGSATAMDVMIDFTLKAMQETLDVHNVDFGWVEQKKIRLAKSGAARPEYETIEFARDGPGVMVRAANSKKTVVVPDTRNDGSFIDGRVLGLNDTSGPILSEMATPVLIDGEPVAVLNIESETLNAFSNEDQRYLEFIAFHTGTALKRLRYEGKLAALHVHSHILGLTESLDEIVDCTLEVMASTLGFEHSDIRVVEDGWLRCKGTSGMEMVNADLPRDGPGVTVKAANSKKTIRVSDARKEPSYVDRIHDKGPKSPTMLSELAVPVVVHDHAVAVLNVESTKTDAIKDSDQTLLEILAAQVGSAMRRLSDSEALRKERNVLRQLIDNLPDNIFIKDVESRFVVSNVAHAHLLRGKTPDEIVGKTDFDIFPRELAAGYYADEQAVIQAGQSLINREERTIDPEGKTRWLLTTKVPLRDDRGRIIGIAGINHDITNRKQMEEEIKRYSEHLEEEISERTKSLRESEQKLRAVVYGCPVPQFVIDRNHTVVYWNKALEEATGIKEKEVIGTRQQWRAFYDSERPCLVDLLVDGNMESIPQLYGGKYRKSTLVTDAFEATDYFPHLGEQGRWLHFTAAVTRDNEGNVTGGVETLEDLTELRNLVEKSVQESSTKTRDLE